MINNTETAFAIQQQVLSRERLLLIVRIPILNKRLK
jgi:hypothetical protein